MTSSKYDTAAKEKWRRRIWKSIRARLLKPAHKAVAVYLAGDGAFDFYEAQDQGFTAWNLIGVDTKKECIDVLRRNGGIGIVGDISTVLNSWRQSLPKIDVLFLDFVGGMTQRNIDCVAGCTHTYALNKHSIFVCNLLAGRDMLPRFRNVPKPKDKETKELQQCWAAHRGITMFTTICLRMSGQKSMYSDRIMAYMKILDAEFHSYRNGRQRYDSLLCNWPVLNAQKLLPSTLAMERKIAAAMAVRTRREKESLDGYADIPAIELPDNMRRVITRSALNEIPFTPVTPQEISPRKLRQRTRR